MSTTDPRTYANLTWYSVILTSVAMSAAWLATL